MAERATPGLFVTGAGTEVGKTYAACLIARELRSAGVRVGVYKPVASGCRREEGRLVSGDALALWEAAGRPGDLDAVCPQRFEAPLAPHLAAAAAGGRVDARLLREGLAPWRRQYDFVVVEGAGGLMSPVTEEELAADLAADIGYPLIVVVRNEIGAIHAALATLMAASAFRPGGKERGSEPLLSVAAVILSDVQPAADASAELNFSELARFAPVPILAHIGHRARVCDKTIDWRTAGPRRATA